MRLWERSQRGEAAGHMKGRWTQYQTKVQARSSLTGRRTSGHGSSLQSAIQVLLILAFSSQAVPSAL